MDQNLECSVSSMEVQRSCAINYSNLTLLFIHLTRSGGFHFCRDLRQLILNFAFCFQERKKIIKGMKGHVGKIAHDQCGTMVKTSFGILPSYLLENLYFYFIFQFLVRDRSCTFFHPILLFVFIIIIAIIIIIEKQKTVQDQPSGLRETQRGLTD